ncbi:MAG TPA: hypothetical protein VMV29_12330 [Ktedonobacterales bacterium]|nr:hypothetical protein [Ktedonobacterales bacterium]
MDEYGDAALPDEFAALADASQVMRETLALVDDLREATMRLGDALVDGGLPAREWRDDDAWLDLLSERLPALSLDDFLTELARFAADEGPNLLHGDASDLAAFAETITQYHESARTLRVVAQRLRLAGAHERGAELPLAEALAGLRVSAPLDRLTTTLRDLESLQPFLTPLTRREWDALNRPAPPPPPILPSPAPERPSGRLAAPAPAQQERPSGPLLPQPGPDRPSGRLAPPAMQSPAQAPVAPTAQAQESPPWPKRAYASAQASNLADEATRPITPQEARQATQGFSRLRDFAPTQEVEIAPTGRSAAALAGRPGALVARLPVGMRPPMVWAFRHRLLATALIIALLASGVGLTAYLTSAQSARLPAPAVSRLTFSPAQLTLACSGAGATAHLTLTDPALPPTATPSARASAEATAAATRGKAVATATPTVISWRAPTGGPLVVAPTHGGLTPGAHATLTVSVSPRTATKTATAATSTAKATKTANTPTPRPIQGTLTLTASDGLVSVPYVETC